MAKQELRDRAITMRKGGAPYSTIKSELKVSKSTLSIWLQEYPLAHSAIRKLKAGREQQIEKTRETKARKKRARLLGVYQDISKQLGALSARELFIAGILLYWAEGTKTAPSVVCMTNTDPSVLVFFLSWLKGQGVKKADVKVKLHLYADMNVEKETQYWTGILGISETQFHKPYIKRSFFNKRINHKGRFSHGTCSIIFYNRDLYETIMAAIKYLGDTYKSKWISRVQKGIVSSRP